MLQIKNSLGKKCAKPNANKVYKMGELIHFFFLLLHQHGLKCLLKAGQLPLPLETRDKVVTAESRI